MKDLLRVPSAVLQHLKNASDPSLNVLVAYLTIKNRDVLNEENRKLPPKNFRNSEINSRRDMLTWRRKWKRKKESSERRKSVKVRIVAEQNFIAGEGKLRVVVQRVVIVLQKRRKQQKERNMSKK